MGFLTTIELSDALPPILGFVKHFPKTAIVRQQWPATGPRKPVCLEFRTKDIVHAPGLRLRRTANKLTKSFAGRIAFPITQQGLHSRTVISELNTEPARSSVNA
jgi:hypothetical protein